ncbi:MAG: HEAT repeat domain-containing protein [Planctomycetes bacterium]|nr:HEAT repeat domain-containing protein [Planctomycetota bacterium]
MKVPCLVVLALAGFLQNPADKPGLPYNVELLDKLKEPAASSRREAALELAKMGADARAAVPDLGKLLVDADGGVRAAATFALGEIGLGAVDTVPTLGRNLTADKDVNVRKESAAAIGKIGPKGIKALPILLKSFRQEGDADVRAAISTAIARVGPQVKETHAALADAIGDPSPEIRELALITLGKIGPAARPALPAIEKAAKDTNEKIALAAQTAQLRVNGEVEEPAPVNDAAAKFELPEWNAFSIPELINLLKSPTPSTRIKAIYQLLKHKKDSDTSKPWQSLPGAFALLLKEDPEPAVRAAAAYGIGQIGQFNAELTRALGDFDTNVRVEAARAFGTLGVKAKEGAKALAQSHISDIAGPVRKASSEALRTMEKELIKINKTAGVSGFYQDVVAALLDGTRKADEEIRARAALALGEYGPNAKDAVTPLCQLLKDPYNYVRVTAASALGELGGDAQQKATGPLEELLNDKDPRVKRRAHESLVKLGRIQIPKPVAVAPPVSTAPTAAPPTTVDPKPATPPESQPTAPDPGKVAVAKPMPGTLEAAVAELLDGEGGITEPSSKIENGKVLLNLQLAHDRFDEGMAHGDAVRLSLKLLMGIDKIDELYIHFIAKNGRLLRSYKVTRAKAAPFFEKADDPFERRRAREWWGEMSERI